MHANTCAGPTLFRMRCSETRRKYIPVGLGPASLRATVSEQAVAIQIWLGWPPVLDKVALRPAKFGLRDV